MDSTKIHYGNFAKSWLAKVFSNLKQLEKIPHSLKNAQTIAILKLGKPNGQPHSYCSIVRLNVIYKLLE